MAPLPAGRGPGLSGAAPVARLGGALTIVAGVVLCACSASSGGGPGQGGGGNGGGGGAGGSAGGGQAGGDPHTRGDSDLPGGDAATTDVAIEELHVAYFDAEYCSPAAVLIECRNYRVTFYVANAAPQRLDGLDRLEIDLAGVQLTAPDLACAQAPWLVNPLVRSALVEVHVMWDDPRTAGITDAKLVLPCAGASVEIPIADPPAAPAAGTATVTLAGPYLDGSPWSTAASTPISDER